MFLDTTSIINQTMREEHLPDLHEAREVLRASCNGGVSESRERGAMAGRFGNAWLVRNGVAN